MKSPDVVHHIAETAIWKMLVSEYGVNANWTL